VYLVCVSLAFDLFIVFILFPHQKSRESVKIGPHPWGQPLSISIKQDIIIYMVIMQGMILSMLINGIDKISII
jgi:hypothetical protein